MSILPSKPSELVTFCATHAPVWSANAASIGLTAGQVLALETATTGTQVALSAQSTARDAAVAATATVHAEAADLRTIAAELLRFIKAYAESQADPTTVYTTAKIPAPADPSPMPAPGTPGDFQVVLTPDGYIDLRWKCTNPRGAAGTTYLVQRRVGSAGAYEFLGAVGEKRFTDETLPAGATEVTYRVQAQRSGLAGTPGLWAVRFGPVGAGGAEGVGGMSIAESFDATGGAGGAGTPLRAAA